MFRPRGQVFGQGVFEAVPDFRSLMSAPSRRGEPAALAPAEGLSQRPAAAPVAQHGAHRPRFDRVAHLFETLHMRLTEVRATEGFSLDIKGVNYSDENRMDDISAN